MSFTCWEMRSKCRTRPRLSLLAISALQTLHKVHSEIRSGFFRYSSPRHVEDGTNTIIRMFRNANEPAIKSHFQHGSHGVASRLSWGHKNQSFYVDRLPSSENVPWADRFIWTVSIQHILINSLWFIAFVWSSSLWRKNVASVECIRLPLWNRMFSVQFALLKLKCEINLIPR